MKCETCMAENPEEAVFCQNCGRRLDGKKSCPACKTLNNQEANYCIACGKKLSGGQYCINCGKHYEGNVCPACGVVSDIVTKPTPSPTAKNGSKAQTVGDIIAGALAMTGVFFALLFTFFIGLASSKASVDTSANIYYYFGNAYTELNESLAILDEIYPLPEFISYFITVLGTLIVAATMVLVLTFSIVALVKYVRKTMKRSDKDYTKCVVAAILSFLCGVAAFMCLHALKATTSANNHVSDSTSIIPNKATIAGLVLSSVFLVAFLVCKVIFSPKPLKEKIHPSVFVSVGCVVAFAVLLALTSIPSIKMVESSQSASYGFSTLGGMLAAMFISQEIPEGYEPTETVMILSPIGVVIQLALIVFIGLALAVFINGIYDRKAKKRPVYIIFCALFALTSLVLAIIITQEILSLGDGSADAGCGCGGAIAAFVFAVIAIGTSIANMIVSGDKPQAINSTPPDTYTA